ncbi:MAG TPA: YajQ family cyclic di-GMP-binding protein [Firmicutes bacterium]|jgi:cyclic-di-GMP-binding protein|nr:YajQ family cyclic di-GMP-binding protein [Bacillota bacterium]
MAADSSFDIVSKVNMQEVDNAVNQTIKEIEQRYDFKGSNTEVTLEGEEIKLLTSDDFKLRSVVDILQTKLIKRSVSIKNLDYGKIEDASGSAKRQLIKVKQGIEMEQAKQIVKDIKASGLKVQAQIMNDQVRVSGKNKDDLQAVIQLVKAKDYHVELQFVNYR